MTKSKLKREITNQKSLVKALLRAQDHITHAISEMVNADRDIEQVVRVLEAGSLPPKRVGKRRVYSKREILSAWTSQGKKCITSPTAKQRRYT